MRLIAAAALLVLLAPAARAQDAAKVKLAWKWEKGSVRRYETSMDQATEFGGNEMAQKFVFALTQEVLAVDEEGTATVKATYDRVKVDMDVPMMGKTDYDSDRDAEAPKDPVGKIMAGVLGKSITLTLESGGKIRKVEGVKAMLDDIMKDLGDEAAGMMGDMFAKQMNDDSMKRQMQQGFAILPRQEIGVGESWTDESELPIPMLGKMKSKSKLTLKELKGDDAVIAIEATMSREKGEDEEGPMGAVELGEAKSKGEITFSVAKGFLVSSKITSTMAMTAGGQDITTTSTTEMKVVPPKAAK